METLLPCAKKIVKQQLIDVFKRIFANVYQANFDKYKEAFHFQIGTFCDLTAMSMLMTAAGVDRVEAMKKAVNAGEAFDNRNQKGYDHTHILLWQKDAAKFEDLMKEWCKLEGSGAVQFKFECPDWHTFTVERIQVKDDRFFQIYQSYQGAYRLLDFLNLAEDGGAELKAHLEKVFAEKSKILPKEAKALAAWKERRDKWVKVSLDQLTNTVKGIGGGKQLTSDALMQYVVSPLKKGLSGRVSQESYSFLTGDVASGDVKIDQMILLMCDTVSPASFDKNYESLVDQNKKLTGYCTPPYKE